MNFNLKNRKFILFILILLVLIESLKSINNEILYAKCPGGIEGIKCDMKNNHEVKMKLYDENIKIISDIKNKRFVDAVPERISLLPNIAAPMSYLFWEPILYGVEGLFHYDPFSSNLSDSQYKNKKSKTDRNRNKRKKTEDKRHPPVVTDASSDVNKQQNEDAFSNSNIPLDLVGNKQQNENIKRNKTHPEDSYVIFESSNNIKPEDREQNEKIQNKKNKYKFSTLDGYMCKSVKEISGNTINSIFKSQENFFLCNTQEGFKKIVNKYPHIFNVTIDSSLNKNQKICVNSKTIPLHITRELIKINQTEICITQKRYQLEKSGTNRNQKIVNDEEKSYDDSADRSSDVINSEIYITDPKRKRFIIDAVFNTNDSKQEHSAKVDKYIFKEIIFCEKLLYRLFIEGTIKETNYLKRLSICKNNKYFFSSYKLGKYDPGDTLQGGRAVELMNEILNEHVEYRNMIEDRKIQVIIIGHGDYMFCKPNQIINDIYPEDIKGCMNITEKGLKKLKIKCNQEGKLLKTREILPCLRAFALKKYLRKVRFISKDIKVILRGKVNLENIKSNDNLVGVPKNRAVSVILMKKRIY